MKIAILGTRGIPNKYGGFEQFAEYLSSGLADRGHTVTVYNPHFHNEAGSSLGKVNICYQYCPEEKVGSLAHFIYDFFCLRDALKKDFDVILECGYGTASVSYLLLPVQNSNIITNMDGIEWKRSKFSGLVKRMMRWFEEIGARKSDHLVADNYGIKRFLKQKYNVESTMIPYGATLFEKPNPAYLESYNVSPGEYFMLIARLEPANNIEMILEGYDRSNNTIPFLVIGNHQTEYGRYFKERFKHNEKIQFLGGVYDQNVVNNLRYFSSAYFHGHSVGGTNPSLLEAMACSSLIIANDNIFNRSVLKEGGLFFEDSEDIARMLNNYSAIRDKREKLIQMNISRIDNFYHWDIIIDAYEQLFKETCGNNRIENE
ncbi:DUF1972 domain-containing protein [Halalkalibaculum sp. DA3122]|uniref:DUF1972 domain-containing protein n=1 Tax=Halalkalibaculum sp. DA3122 TaxID=3373607 RepID=UPI0037552931